jgi:Tol biopolymer transport system component
MLCALDDGPVFSPDGKLLAIYPALTGTGDLWVVPIAGGKPRQLTFDDSAGGHPVWTPDGSSIIFSSARKGSRNIWRIPAAGGTPEPITTGAGEDVEPAISREGTKLIHANVRNTYALMVLDAATGESRQILEQRTPIFWPSVAPTGDWLAFASGGFTGGHVFVVASDGTKLQQIVSETGTTEQLPDWSADGQSLYFLQQGKAELPSLRKVALGGGPSVEVWAFKEHGFYGIPDFAPDGRRVTLNCAENDKNPGAFVRDLPTGSMTKLHVALNQPRWSHDGRSLVGEVLGEQRIYVCPPTGEPCTRLGTVEGVLPFWSHDDSNIYFSVPSHSENSIGLSVVNRDGLGERRIAEMSGVFLPLGFPHGTSSNGMMPWVQFRPGRREPWLADLKR